MKTLKKGSKYSLRENKENYLIIKKGVVYFASSKKEITQKEACNIFDIYEKDIEFVDMIMQVYENS